MVFILEFSTRNISPLGGLATLISRAAWRITGVTCLFIELGVLWLGGFLVSFFLTWTSFHYGPKITDCEVIWVGGVCLFVLFSLFHSSASYVILDEKRRDEQFHLQVVGKGDEGKGSKETKGGKGSQHLPPNWSA